MIRHVVLIKFNPGASEENCEAAFRMLRDLKNEIPGIREWSIGKQLRKEHKHFDVAEVATFEDLESLEHFRTHPAHIRVRDYIKTIATWTVVDYEFA